MQDDGNLSWSLEWAPYFHPSGFVNNISDAPDSMFQDGMITDTAVKRLQLLGAGRQAASSSSAPSGVTWPIDKATGAPVTPPPQAVEPEVQPQVQDQEQVQDPARVRRRQPVRARSMTSSDEGRPSRPANTWGGEWVTVLDLETQLNLTLVIF